jgi:uncharacterized membrane protein YesL
MAQVIRKKKTKKAFVETFKIEWTKINYIILGIGLLFVVVGFFLMAQGPWDNPLSLSVSPVVLLIAYLIIFPVAILYKKKEEPKNDTGKN